LAQYEDLKDIIAMLGLEQLSPEDRNVVARARRLERFLTQPFFATEQLAVSRESSSASKDSLDGCERILRDEFKDYPESALYMIGPISEAKKPDTNSPKTEKPKAPRPHEPAADSKPAAPPPTRSPNRKARAGPEAKTLEPSFNRQSALMNLKILLPIRIFARKPACCASLPRLCDGSFGLLLPHRLDCVAALVPGNFDLTKRKEGETRLRSRR
jgi:hypothetical protein